MRDRRGRHIARNLTEIRLDHGQKRKRHIHRRQPRDQHDDNPDRDWRQHDPQQTLVSRIIRPIRTQSLQTADGTTQEERNGKKYQQDQFARQHY
ncbi:hypothetical protein [Asticcacaulis biprosthecium]|uniref:hypothetical protein n=1 Tax=Asticcacaulis biprosthecium TaxID=76891 RepID=UPI001B7F833E|nr:hypothetical protein [Asticcacaulis biprosthecium]